MSTTVTKYLERYSTKVVVSWTSDGSGAASEAIRRVVGDIRRVTFVPGSGGTQPTNSYDVTLTDEHGIDVLAGQGANLSNTTATHVSPGVPLKDGTTTHVAPVFIDGTLTLAVANAGNAKTGTVTIYMS